jgi:large subunit ribosomal protein L28
MSRTCDLTGIGTATGNKVSHSAHKTRRKFLPNLQNAELKSEVLNRNLKLRLAARTIRTVNKYGSLDLFLVNFGANKLSAKGNLLRRKIVKKLVKEERLYEVKTMGKTRKSVAEN